MTRRDEAGRQARARAAPEKVLVIEDDPAVRQLLVKLLRRAGYQPIESGDGMSGLAAFREHRPSLVVSDLLLPDGMGLSAIAAIREEDPDVPILVISGADGILGKDILLQRALERGATRAMAKPFDPSALTRTIDALWEASARTHRDGKGTTWRISRRGRFRFDGGPAHPGLLFDSGEGAFFVPHASDAGPLSLDRSEIEAMVQRAWYRRGGGLGR